MTQPLATITQVIIGSSASTLNSAYLRVAHDTTSVSSSKTLTPAGKSLPMYMNYPVDITWAFQLDVSTTGGSGSLVMRCGSNRGKAIRANPAPYAQAATFANLLGLGATFTTVDGFRASLAGGDVVTPAKQVVKDIGVSKPTVPSTAPHALLRTDEQAIEVYQVWMDGLTDPNKIDSKRAEEKAHWMVDFINATSGSQWPWYVKQRATAGSKLVSRLQELKAANDSRMSGITLPTDSTPLNALSENLETMVEQLNTAANRAVRNWWLRRMLVSKHPLSERLVQFWHNLWTTEANHYILALQQQKLFRDNLAGDYKTFAKLMATDPEMLLYLNNTQNGYYAKWENGQNVTKWRGNENFARELLELFLLGASDRTEAYTGDDIKRVAHAFTGYQRGENPRAFLYNNAEHWHWNSATKDAEGNAQDRVIFGNPSANYTGVLSAPGRTIKAGTGQTFATQDVIDLAFAVKHQTQVTIPQVAVHLTEQLWRRFIGAIPADGSAEQGRLMTIASTFATSGFKLATLYEAFFCGQDYLDPVTNPDHRFRTFKSPAEHLISILRSLGVTEGTPATSPANLLWLCEQADQQPFNPPNVAGDIGGEDWINTRTYLVRFVNLTNTIANKLAGNVALDSENMDPDALRTLLTQGEGLVNIHGTVDYQMLETALSDPLLNLL